MQTLSCFIWKYQYCLHEILIFFKKSLVFSELFVSLRCGFVMIICTSLQIIN